MIDRLSGYGERHSTFWKGVLHRAREAHFVHAMVREDGREVVFLRVIAWQAKSNVGCNRDHVGRCCPLLASQLPLLGFYYSKKTYPST